MVIKKPMLFMIVSAVPVNSGGALAAADEENCGESMITANPQIIKNGTNNHIGSIKANGDEMMQSKLTESARKATFSLPIIRE